MFYFFLILNHFIGDDKVIHRCYLTAETNIRLRMDKAIAEKEITEFVKFYCYSLPWSNKNTMSPVSWASNQSRSPSSPPLSHLRKREETSQTAVLPCPSPVWYLSLTRRAQGWGSGYIREKDGICRLGCMRERWCARRSGGMGELIG